MQKKIFKIFGIILLVIILIGVISTIIMINKYKNDLKPLTQGQKSNKVQITIPEGYGIKKITKLLEDKKVVKNAFSMQVYIKLNKINNLQAGKYIFDTSNDDVPKVLEKLKKGEIKDESIKIAFVEGKSVKQYAKIIAEKTNNTEEDFLDLIKDEDFLDSLIEEYWFIDENIKDEDIYYSLEGYLLPDTYTFKDENVTCEEIIKVLLTHTDKALSPYKEIIYESGYTPHEMLVLASIVELEGKNLEARQRIAGVLYNRITLGMNLGCDVTTYYAVQKNMADGDLTKKELKIESPYNTRLADMKGKLPIGPICNPSKEAITAVMEPIIDDSLYFVADKNGKVYFTKDYSEHNKIIKELKEEGLWFEY